VRTAEEVNAEMLARGQDPAWKRGTQVVERDAQPGERFKMVVSSGQEAKLRMGDRRALGGWASPDPVPNQTYARNQLTIIEKYKSDVSYVAEIPKFPPNL
jgi:hypothetical protein